MQEQNVIWRAPFPDRNLAVISIGMAQLWDKMPETERTRFIETGEILDTPTGREFKAQIPDIVADITELMLLIAAKAQRKEMEHEQASAG